MKDCNWLRTQNTYFKNNTSEWENISLTGIKGDYIMDTLIKHLSGFVSNNFSEESIKDSLNDFGKAIKDIEENLLVKSPLEDALSRSAFDTPVDSEEKNTKQENKKIKIALYTGKSDPYFTFGSFYYYEVKYNYGNKSYFFQDDLDSGRFHNISKNYFKKYFVKPKKAQSDLNDLVEAISYVQSNKRHDNKTSWCDAQEIVSLYKDFKKQKKQQKKGD